jgi:hypothetical protein
MARDDEPILNMYDMDRQRLDAPHTRVLGDARGASTAAHFGGRLEGMAARCRLYAFGKSPRRKSEQVCPLPARNRCPTPAPRT